MTIQHWLMLAFTTAAAVYMARGLFKPSCATGCGGCKKGCPAKKLAVVRQKLKDSHC